MITELDLSSEKAKKQYYGIDLMKFICAIFVVEIHVPPLKDISPFFNYILGDYLGRLAVPFFFIASGYFLFRKTNYDYFDQRISFLYVRKILRIYLIWTFLYLIPMIYYLIWRKRKQGILYGIINIVKTVLIRGYRHLWYLHAVIIAVLIITILLKKKYKIQSILIIGMVLYLIGLLAQSWFGIIRPLEKNPFLWKSLKLIKKIIGTTRNGIFEGMLFLGIGMLFAYRNIIIKFSYAVIGFFISMILMLAEAIFVNYFHFCRLTDMYLFLVPSAFFLFYIMLHVKLKEKQIYIKLRKYSMFIYLIHWWIALSVSAAAKLLKRYYKMEMSSFFKFFMVVIISYLAAKLFYWLIEEKKWTWLQKLI